jgi:hypothetical protein
MRWIYSMGYNSDEHAYEIELAADASLEQIELAEEFADVLLQLSERNDEQVSQLLESAYQKGMQDALAREVH